LHVLVGINQQAGIHVPVTLSPTVDIFAVNLFGFGANMQIFSCHC
jgi:hypothetical protein